MESLPYSLMSNNKYGRNEVSKLLMPAETEGKRFAEEHSICLCLHHLKL